jgi:hypothetical protein
MADRLEALERLARLHAAGALSDDEFAAEKRKILEGGVLPPEPVPIAAPAPPAQAVPPAVSAVGAGDTRAEWMQRHRWPLAAAGAALLFGGYFAYATVQDLRQAVPADEKAARADSKGTAKGRGGTAPVGAADDIAWLSFEDSKSCSPGPELRALVEDMAGRQPAEGETAETTIRLPGGGEPVPLQVRRIAVEGARTAPVAAQVETTGGWRGLDVRALRTVAWPGGQVRSLQIRFGNPPGEVRRALTEAGFELAAVGELRNTTAGDRGVALGIEEITGGAALTCLRG